MFADRIQSCLLAFFFGALATALVAFGSFQRVAMNHAVTLRDTAWFAWLQPVDAWPTDLAWASVVALLLGSTIAIAVAWMLWNVRWTYRARDLSSADAAAELLRKSATSVPRIFAGKFGDRDFFASVEDRGLVVGPPGTGKTAFLLNQILRATAQHLNFVAVDLKPELHNILAPRLEAAGYRVLRINPARPDASADHWNPLEDCEDETDVAELCAALLPIRDAREAPFIESQRDWLKAVVFHVKAQAGGSIPAAFGVLSDYSEPTKLLDVLRASPSQPAARLARRMLAGLAGQKPDPLILQGLSGALRALDFLGLPGVQAALSYSDFSVRELGTGAQPIALFLQFQEAKLGALGSLLAFMSTAVLTSLIDTAGQRAPVALFLDELGNMPPIPGLLEKLNTIRSRHIPCWMYFQTTEQMNRRYGDGADSVFFAAADVQMVFRLNDNSTRELISTLVGTTMKLRRTRSTGGGRGSTAEGKQRENVIEPFELGRLKVSEVVCLYRGAAARGRATPHYTDFPEFRRKA